MDYKLYATKGTANFLKENNIKTETLHWPLEEEKPNIVDFIKEGNIDLVINIPKNFEREELTNGQIIRRTAIDFGIPLVTNPQNAKLLIDALHEKKLEDIEVKSWDEFK